MTRIERKFMFTTFDNITLANNITLTSDTESPDDLLFTTLLLRATPADLTSDFQKKSMCSLAEQTNTKYQIVDNLSELYFYLANPNNKIDVIGLEIENLYSIAGPDVWSLIHTIGVILTVTNSDAVIAGGVTLNTNPKHIKDFLSLSHRCIGVFPEGPEFSNEEKLKAAFAIKSKIPHVPEKIKKILNPKKADDSSGIKLTKRQEQILSLIISRGATNKMIARSLNISESTVKLHVAGLLSKFNATNRTQLAMSVKNKV